MIAPNENGGGKMINWTVPMLERFEKAYKKAYDKNPDPKSAFEFEGNLFILGYAQYLIEFLQAKFGTKDKKH